MIVTVREFAWNDFHCPGKSAVILNACPSVLSARITEVNGFSGSLSSSFSALLAGIAVGQAAALTLAGDDEPTLAGEAPDVGQVAEDGE